MTGLLSRLRQSVLDVSGRAVNRVLHDPRGAKAVGTVAGVVQRSKRRLDRTQEQVLHVLGFAHRGDYQAVGRQLNSARRKAKALLARLDKVSAPAPK
jgi:hypothetical protein